jgi:molybdopterin molybdotransferase
MDGCAVRHADLDGSTALPVAFEVAADGVPPPLPEGAAARIFTGAQVPRGADTVVPQELARVEDGARVVLERLDAGSHVRMAGEVLSSGGAVAGEGDLITPQRLALLAAGGSHRVRVIPRPRVAVVVTGSELVELTEVPGPGQIRNTNGPLLDGLARQAGLAAPVQRGSVDREGELVSALGEAFEAAELVLTSGGVSVGEYDLVPDVVRSLGGEVVFHRVAVKPGKPVLVARRDHRWLVGLPGNPVSVLVGWWLFARPVAEALAGNSAALSEEFMPATLLEPVPKTSGREEFRPAVIHGSKVRIIDWRGSHDLVAAAGANALARLAPRTAYRAGDTVTCLPI